jgi:hypothetical protein
MPGIPLSYFPIESPEQSPKKPIFRFNKTASLASFLIVPLLIFFIIKMTNTFYCINNLKPSHPDFVGRETQLASIEKICMHGWGSTVPTVLLWGEAGVGKSEIAVTFANKHLNDFSLIFIIDSSSEENKKTSYYKLANKLNIELASQQPVQENIFKIHQWLEKNHHPWLLIYDNAEIPLEIPDKGKGSVIITARNKIASFADPCIEVEPFTIEEASALITKITREEPGLYRSSLIQELGYFPMALSIAAHYIADTAEMSEQKYLQLLNQDKICLIETCRNSEKLLASWRITAQMLSQKSPKALEWLHFCTYLSPKGVSIHWIEEWINSESSFSRKILSNEILRTLVNQALVRYDKNTQKIYLHRLKQEIIQQDSYLKPQIQEQVFQFLITHLKVTDWSLHASWFLDHYGPFLLKENRVHLKKLLEKRDQP